MLAKLVVIAAFLALAQANYIRINNTGSQNLLYVLEAVGHPADTPQLLEAGNYTEIVTLNEWEGSFYAYPEECLETACEFPVTKISVAFERFMFNGFYDMLIVDIVEGFNVPASIKSLTQPECARVACDADLLQACPEENQIVDASGNVVSCRSAPEVFKELCPDAIVYPTDLNLFACFSMDYEVTFG